MRELDNKELDFVGGAGDPLADPNSQILRQVMANAAWGAAFVIRGGLPGMAVGMAGGVAQTVIQGAAAQMPVNVPIPQVPMGPTWNGSKG
ncbi:microcin [Salmonella enterica subsp. salamae]|nr:microcin [Salmonella enterica subsp. salamae]ECI4078813.1 microcin [Salmonella enterica subsp. salamae]EEO2383838.1 microcin [Salmonella enterica]